MIVKIKSIRHLDRYEHDARRVRLKPKFYLTTALFVCLGLQPATGVAQEAASSLLTTNSPFVLYLQNPPWIKGMLYVESIHWFSGPSPSQITKTGWDNHTNQISIQPGGIYIERLTDPSDGPPRPQTERIIEGSSGHYDWSVLAGQPADLPDSLALSSKFPAEGGSSKNRLFRGLQRKKLWIEQIRHFGLPQLITNSFTLDMSNQFRALTAEGYLLRGKVLSAANNQPIKLCYFFDDTNDVYFIKYGYHFGEFLPAYFECSESRNGHLFGDVHTNWICRVDYGVNLEFTNGYEPSMFFSNLAIFTHIILESNGQRYSIGKTGKRNLIDESGPHLLTKNGGGRKTEFIILLVFLATVGAFTWRFRKRDQEM